jgi:hypothetical protein
MLTFAANGKAYTHGYRRDVPPINYASAPVVLAETKVEPAFGADELPAVVRETASLVPTAISSSALARVLRALNTGFSR